MLERLTSPGGSNVSYDKCGDGPPLVLVHGSFSDHNSNWEFVKPILQERFALYAVARRGRGETEMTEGHSVEDEATDVTAIIEKVGDPVFLLGHSYGAHCALVATRMIPHRVRKLILYEPIWPALVSNETLARLEEMAKTEAWGELALTFFRDTLAVPVHEIDAIRPTDVWPPIVSDAKATLGDLRAIHRYNFDPVRFRSVECPVLLQIGSESPRHLYATDALAAALPNVRIEELPGQAHEGMTTAPEMYAEAVIRFLLG